MNRRGFFGTLGKMAAAAALIDPEKLLWRPEAKTIFIPRIVQPEIFLESTAKGYYGWVQTQGIANVLSGNDPVIHMSSGMFEAVQDGAIAHVELYRDDKVQYVYSKCGELIKRGSVVTWVDHCKDELRLCGPGDIPIGVKL